MNLTNQKYEKYFEVQSKILNILSFIPSKNMCKQMHDKAKSPAFTLNTGD